MDARHLGQDPCRWNSATTIICANMPTRAVRSALHRARARSEDAY
jgi:hypothetical protein